VLHNFEMFGVIQKAAALVGFFRSHTMAHATMLVTLTRWS